LDQQTLTRVLIERLVSGFFQGYQFEMFGGLKIPDNTRNMAVLVLPTLVEFLGTFIFLSVIVATGNPWAIGATLAILIFLGLDVSGGHYNPAVTLMTLYNKGIAATTAGFYIVAQVAGGILAITLHNLMKTRGV